MKQQMRLQQDGTIVEETPEMIAAEGDEAQRKQKLNEASNSVLELMGKDTEKNWVELYLIIAEVEEEQLYKPEYKSLTAWGAALAERGKFNLRELWRKKRAGEVYRAYERRKEALGKVARPWEPVDARGVSPRNLEMVAKIAGGDKKAEERMIDQLSAGKLTRKQLEGLWDTAKAAGAKVRKSRHDVVEEPKEEGQKAITAARIVAAIQSASDGSWLPEEHKKRPWIKDKYRVFTEVPVYLGTTAHPVRIDAVVIETFGCEYMTDVIIHAIEIKISESDLQRDVKMGEYAKCADYMWMAVPEGLKDAAKAHIDELQVSQKWGLLIITTDPETEEDHLSVARIPKRVDGGFRGEVCEYLVAQYI